MCARVRARADEKGGRGGEREREGEEWMSHGCTCVICSQLYMKSIRLFTVAILSTPVWI